MSNNVRVRFRGTEYIWMKDSDGTGGLAPLDHFDANGDLTLEAGLFGVSYAYVERDGVYRFNQRIGEVSEVEQTDGGTSQDAIVQ